MSHPTVPPENPNATAEDYADLRRRLIASNNALNLTGAALNRARTQVVQLEHRATFLATQATRAETNLVRAAGDRNRAQTELNAARAALEAPEAEARLALAGLEQEMRESARNVQRLNDAWAEVMRNLHHRIDYYMRRLGQSQAENGRLDQTIEELQLYVYLLKKKVRKLEGEEVEDAVLSKVRRREEGDDDDGGDEDDAGAGAGGAPFERTILTLT
ncbi:hypothetical protein BDZ85DRAFT_282949 [Elsinoe ampelina]|uniref:Uncharacterized protein n=1 Tax=Elsinoe ampelina TaxID=302913 RepID=A0A6A6G7Z7_9PEZI|nr:hypothetical protein BDZ85DRAFT_282949 [Elsinoe ampelina]